MENRGLSEEDQQRLERYLKSPHCQREREFRPWRLLTIIWVVLVLLSGVSYGLAQWHGVV